MTQDSLLPRFELAFQLDVAIGKLIVTGATKHGTRQLFPILGGEVFGPKLTGMVLGGGADWQLQRSDGVLELDARYVIEASDGCPIQVRNRGLLRPSENGLYVRTVPQFEAPSEGPHAWLNRSLFIGSVAFEKPEHVLVSVYEVK